MTDYTLARVDEVLTELVELVETARTIPMSASCVLPRERTLDLLDALREVLPPEVMEARRVVAQREQLLGDADRRTTELVAEATEQAEQLVAAARTEAAQLLAAAQAEQAELVSATGVHQAAVAEAGQLNAQAEQYATATRAEAEQYAERLGADAQDYASQTLTELVGTLQRLLGTAENGLSALHRRDGRDDSE